jgi:protein TonB
MYSFLLFLAVFGQSAPTGTPPVVPQVLRLFSVNDYPVEALQNHWEGSVIADLTVSPKGVITDCRIVKSSGYTLLDRTTCNILHRRAQFRPFRDPDGKPTQTIIRTPPIEWALY